MTICKECTRPFARAGNALAQLTCECKLRKPKRRGMTTRVMTQADIDKVHRLQHQFDAVRRPIGA
jgi:hypothetical protein